MASGRWSSEDGGYSTDRYSLIVVLGILVISLISRRPPIALVILVVVPLSALAVYLRWRRATRR
jgi:hypothetical protein